MSHFLNNEIIPGQLEYVRKLSHTSILVICCMGPLLVLFSESVGSQQIINDMAKWRKFEDISIKELFMEVQECKRKKVCFLANVISKMHQFVFIWVSEVILVCPGIFEILELHYETFLYSSYRLFNMLVEIVVRLEVLNWPPKSLKAWNKSW